MVTGNGATRTAGAARLAAVALVSALLSFLVPALVAAPSAGAASSAPRNTVWLCRPGQAADPCTYSRAYTTISATGSTHAVASPAPTKNAKKFDCFYVYPTVSTENSLNSDLAVQKSEIYTAVLQAARFSQVCNVWAPMYHQATSLALSQGRLTQPSVLNTAYNSVLSAWKDYLAHDNHGRPIIFIGHSQGASMLIKLLRAQVDPSAKLRAHVVSAIILGGNVQVPLGKVVGGTFQNIPLCTSATQNGCVIAYSSFGNPPPSNSFFGVTGQGVSLVSGQTASSGLQVACVNPVTFSGAPGHLLPYFLDVTSGLSISVVTPWVSYPGLYTATCKTSRGATWLQVDTSSRPGDPRPKVAASYGPDWGYHVYDANLALGDLVYDVAVQEAAYH
jgi:hypothetical protein